jgi:hypothetical protein
MRVYGRELVFGSAPRVYGRELVTDIGAPCKSVEEPPQPAAAVPRFARASDGASFTCSETQEASLTALMAQRIKAKQMEYKHQITQARAN